MSKVYPSHNVPPKFGPRWLKPTIQPAFFPDPVRKSDKAINITLAVAFIFVMSLLLVEWFSL